MTGTPRNRGISAGMKTNAAGLPWRCKRNAEMNTDFTVMLLFLWFQWK